MTRVARVFRVHLQTLVPARADTSENEEDVMDDDYKETMNPDLIEAMDDKRLIDGEFDEGELMLEITGREFPTCQ